MPIKIACLFTLCSSRGFNPQRWLDAFNDVHASIYTFSPCMTLADINADGNYKLVISDLGTGTTNVKLKVQSQTYSSTCFLHLSNWFFGVLQCKDETECKKE
jgi:hypothetical protein